MRDTKGDNLIGQRFKLNELLQPKNYIMIGAGYVAPRHAKAIKETGSNLLAFVDPNDSVGWIDSYFPEAAYFREFERFDRYVNKLQRDGIKIDYCSVVTPSYLHDPNCRWALRSGISAICEKPLVIHERNLDALQELEIETEKRVWTIFQLRYHQDAIDRKKTLDPKEFYGVNVRYQTPRGNWYRHSWKNDVKKSGGLPTNIGIHLFDLCSWFFGTLGRIQVDYIDDDVAQGELLYDRAAVNWLLSIRMDAQPERSFRIGGVDLELSNGFAELHTKAYQEILKGNGIGLEDVRESVKIAEFIRDNGKD